MPCSSLAGNYAPTRSRQAVRTADKISAVYRVVFADILSV